MEYKLYCLDRTQRIVSARVVMVTNDMAAMEEAQKLRQIHGVEVWQGARLVAHVKLVAAPQGSANDMRL